LVEIYPIGHIIGSSYRLQSSFPVIKNKPKNIVFKHIVSNWLLIRYVLLFAPYFITLDQQTNATGKNVGCGVPQPHLRPLP
jgi:hypothetical protein